MGTLQVKLYLYREYHVRFHYGANISHRAMQWMGISSMPEFMFTFLSSILLQMIIVNTKLPFETRENYLIDPKCK